MRSAPQRLLRGTAVYGACAFSFSLSPFSFAVGLLSFGTAVVACTSDIGTYVGVVAEAGWGVVDERAYLISHDGDGVLAE